MFKRKSLIVIFCLAIISAIFCIYLRSLYMVPVLMYHSVNPKTNQVMNRLIVSPETFQKQMQFLKSQHYNVLPLSEVAQLIKDKRKIPHKTVAITFDDGYKDNYTYAYPVLKKLNFPATIFIIYNEVGRAEGDRLSWKEIKQMQESGLITFGSHTLGATPLVDIKSETELRRQIFDSKIMIEEKINRPVDIFCYVGGMFTPRIKELTKEAGYKFAVSTAMGKNLSNDDIYAIKRIRISESSRSNFKFWIKLSGYYDSFRNKKNE